MKKKYFIRINFLIKLFRTFILNLIGPDKKYQYTILVTKTIAETSNILTVLGEISYRVTQKH